jgi:DUF1680 family protein
VTLDDGLLRRQLDTVKEYYLRIPNDDLLKGFRSRAGKRSPGEVLEGWYRDDIFHVFGQILSGLSRLYAATGDPACRAKTWALVEGWQECIADDGFFYFTREPKANAYIYDKMVGGLVDAYLFTGDLNAKKALGIITGWAERNLNRARPYGSDPNEWYTLSENLYRAYLATGEERYRDFAKVWEYTEYWGLYADKSDIHGTRPGGPPFGGYHAYSHVNTLGGAGAAYLITGEKHYLATLVNAYDYLQKKACFATGGYGPDEVLSAPPDRRSRLKNSHNTFETQCGSWAGFKLAKYLMRFTGQSKYGNWIERLAYNGIAASIPMTARGNVFYYSDYNPGGGRKVNHDTPWTCCTGTRPIAVSELQDLIYFQDPEGIYVNLYTPSTVKLRRRDSDVTITQRTHFPESDYSDFRVAASKPLYLKIAFRAPDWLAAPLKLSVNGKPLALKPDGRGWVAVDRLWKNHDSVRVTLPAKLRAEKLDPDLPFPFALARGPVVLAARSAKPLSDSTVRSLAEPKGLMAMRGEALTYRLESDNDVIFRPFYAFKEGERYFLYLDPDARLHVPAGDAKIAGSWQGGSSFRFTNAVGASATVTFEGAGVRWLGGKYDDAGRAEVKIDGKVVATVDQYGPGRNLPFDWRIDGLAPGTHTLQITVLPGKSSESKDRFINFAGFEIIPAR